MPNTYTVCFCGTGCSRDEGEQTRYWDYRVLGLLKGERRLVSDKRIYDSDTGYIPVRIHRDISHTPDDTSSSVTVRGVGENDWYDQMNSSDALRGFPLAAPGELREYLQTCSSDNQRSMSSQVTGWAAAALALHGANLAASSKAEQYNFLGHSRGAVEAIMAAWFLYAYGGRTHRNIPINIFAIDPVPGTGEWYGILTQLPPNVVNYVGVYAWDHLDESFSALVPRPNARMTMQRAHLDIETQGLGGTWSSLADNRQLADPLAASAPSTRQPLGYQLYACRGRHGTVAGNSTSDGKYDPSNVSAAVAAVPRLVYKLARAYLTLWGTSFRTRSRVRENARQLRKRIHTAHADFDTMAGGEARTARRVGRPYVRRISSISGRLGWNRYYLEDVVGDPPYKLAYPCTVERSGEGWVKWKFL